jgi:hypothetical protein
MGRAHEYFRQQHEERPDGSFHRRPDGRASAEEVGILVARDPRVGHSAEGSRYHALTRTTP